MHSVVVISATLTCSIVVVSVTLKGSKVAVQVILPTFSTLILETQTSKKKKGAIGLVRTCELQYIYISTQITHQDNLMNVTWEVLDTFYVNYVWIKGKKTLKKLLCQYKLGKYQ